MCEYAKIAADTVVDYGFFSKGDGLELFSSESWLNDLQPDSSYMLIAHSMGALFALRNSQLRNSAERIIIYSGFARFAESEDNPYGKRVAEIEVMRKQLRRNPAMLLRSFYRTMMAPQKLRISQMEYYNTEKLDEGLELLKNCDIRNELDDLSVPVEIIHGAEDKIVSVKLAEYLHARIPSSELNIQPDKGHGLIFLN